MIKQGLVDLDPFDYEMSLEEHLEITKPCVVQSFKIGQLLKEPDKKILDLNSLLIHTFTLMTCILIGYLFLFMVTFIFLKRIFFIYNFFKILKLFIFELSFNDLKRIRLLSGEIALIFLSFDFLHFILMKLFCNSIKTNRIVVNTDEFIDSAQKLLKTSKIFAFSNDNIHKFSEASKNSLLYKFYVKKVIKELKFLNLDLNLAKYIEILKSRQIDSLIFFLKKSHILMYLSYSAKFAENQLAFMGRSSYLEVLHVFYMNKRLELTKKKYIHKR